MEAYNLAVDCGGSKVTAILYDNAFRPVASCRVGSTRWTSTPPEIITRNARELIGKLNIAGKTLTLCGLVDKGLHEELSRQCRVEKILPLGEMQMGFAAAGCSGDGYLALAGTGATFFCRKGEQVFVAGGYGSVVADEGSGYWIGREVLNAAIRDREGWGSRTMLRQLVHDRLGAEDAFPNAVLNLYRVPGVSPVAAVAACAPLASQGAAAGDEVAKDILRRAGNVLGRQMAALSRRERLSPELPVAISGSVWRGDPVIFAEFCRALRENGLTGDILVPEFEPVVGIILCHKNSLGIGFTPEEAERFREYYSPWKFKIHNT